MAEQDEKLPALQKKMNIKSKQAIAIASKHHIVRFMGSILERTPKGWHTITPDDFARIAYKELGAGATKSQIQDLEHLFFVSAEDVSTRFKYIGMPNGDVWDTKKVGWTKDISSEDCIFTTAVSPTYGDTHRKWLEEVSCGDKQLADDIMWAIAPIFMFKKPFGIFWFLGAGGNGKSTVLKTVYEIFNGKNAPFTKLSLTAIEDGRDTPTMNGKLGNVCIESHDGHIKDAGNYKHLADHDDFEVHKMRSNNNIKVNGNLHTIFNTNNIPTFGDKTKAIRDRTFTIPFKAEFARNQNFDENLWEQENLLSDFLGELLESAKAIKKNKYNYRLSPLSLAAKADYDEEANSAEAYIKELIDHQILAFDSFEPLYRDYETWCKERGNIQLGRRTVANAAKVMGYERKGYRPNGKFVMKYALGDVKFEDIREIPHRWGLWQERTGDLDLVTPEDEADNNLQEMLKGL